MVHPSSAHRLLLAAIFAASVPAVPTLAASHHRHSHHSASSEASTSDTAPTPPHTSHQQSGCTAPLAAGQHDPSVRDVRLQRGPDGGGTVTMCLVSNQATLINPSASIGIFGKDGILAGTAAKAMAGKFQPTVGPAGGLRAGQQLTIVPFSFDVPSDPPLPAALQTTAMVQLAWDTCPDEACTKPDEQSLALLQPLKISGGSDHEPTVASNPPPADDAAPAAAKPSRHAHHTAAAAHHDKPGDRPRAAGSVAPGQVY